MPLRPRVTLATAKGCIGALKLKTGLSGGARGLKRGITREVAFRSAEQGEPILYLPERSLFGFLT